MDAKKYLSQYRIIKQNIGMQIKDLNKLKQQYDEFVEFGIEETELEYLQVEMNFIKEEIAKLFDDLAHIFKVISDIPSTKGIHKLIAHLRYIKGMTWDAICFEVSLSKRTVGRIHEETKMIVQEMLDAEECHK